MTTDPVGQPNSGLSVVILGHTANLGGAELALLRFLDAVPSDAAAVTVVLFADGPLVGLLRHRGISVEVVPMPPSLGSANRRSALAPAQASRFALRLAPFLWRLRRRVKRLKPALIVTTTLKAHLSSAGLVGIAPIVWHLHDRLSSDYLPVTLSRLLIGLADRIPRIVIANSTATASTLHRAATVVAYPGLQADQFLDSPADRRTPARPVVGIVSRISPTKGQLEFVKAAALVVRQVPDASFVVVGSALFGEAEYGRAVLEQIERVGLADCFELIEHVTDPRQIMDRLSVLVHASPVPEPFGQVVTEALARCVPVVATDAGGIPEILAPPGQAPLGRLVPPGDVAGLAAAIVDVLSDREPHEASARGWQVAHERFTIQRTASIVTDAWTAAAHGRSGAHTGRLAFLYVSDWTHEFRDVAAGVTPTHRLFGAAELARDGVTVCNVQRHARHRRIPWSLYQAGWVLFRQRQVDAFVATHEAAAAPSLILRRLGLLRRPVVVLTVAAVDAIGRGSGKAQVLRWSLRGADALVVLASDQVAPLARGLGVSRARVRFLPFGVDTDFFSLAKPQSGTAGPDVLSVGTNAGKDFVTLIRALPDQASCLIITDEQSRRRAIAAAQAREVEFDSDVPIARLRELYAAAGVVVIPLHDVPFSSGQTVLLENMAMGRRVIVTDVPGVRDYVDPQLTDAVRPGDVMGLRAAILRFSIDPERAFRDADVIRGHTVDRFSSRAFAQQLVRLIAELTDSSFSVPTSGTP